MRPPARSRALSVLRRVLVALAGIALLVFLGAYAWISHPTEAREPLPSDLVALDTPAGAALLQDADAWADHAPLMARFEAQEKRSWCGPASAAMVLGALGGAPVRQADVLRGRAATVQGSLRTTFSGMTLDTFAAILEAHGLTVQTHHAEVGGIAAFRADLVSLSDASDVLVVNLLRGGLSQEGGGHFSPISAWDRESDRALLLDTAAYRFPPTWVPVERLYAAMATLDDSSGEHRGWVRAR